MLTGLSKEITVLGKKLTFFNQRSQEWTHPYAWDNDGSDLHDAGCGIFSLCHIAQWLTGLVQDPTVWADFSVAEGGRGDDGTDRPALLHALMASGNAAKLGFRYEEDGLRNDRETLYTHLLAGNAAMCNLRPGHIVALVAAREQDGIRQVLAIDSVCESARDKLRSHVTEVIPGSEIRYVLTGKYGQPVGQAESYAAFWVEASVPVDFNLLYRI